MCHVYPVCDICTWGALIFGFYFFDSDFTHFVLLLLLLCSSSSRPIVYTVVTFYEKSLSVTNEVCSAKGI